MIHGRARARLGFFALALSLAAIAHPTPAFPQNDSTATSPADTVAIPAPVGHVNDFASVMDDASRAKLESFLAQVQEKTGAEFAVMTVKTTGVDDPMQYKVKVFERWHLGKKGEDNGLLLLVALQERAAYFETGYGLEGVLPDGLESRIHREIMLPRFRQEDYAGAITQGMLACAAKVAEDKGVKLEWNGSELRYDDSGGTGRPGVETIILLIVVFFIVMSIVGRLRRYGGYRGGGGWWIGPMMGGGGWRGGGWGGGFGGGGGGGGFGGFGGGSSGGGGGGGHW
jgi:uncharacterized protein